MNLVAKAKYQQTHGNRRRTGNVSQRITSDEVHVPRQYLLACQVSYRRRLRYLLLHLCDVFRALICFFTTPLFAVSDALNLQVLSFQSQQIHAGTSPGLNSGPAALTTTVVPRLVKASQL